MAQLYKYYQLIGGDEPWTPIQADADLDKLKPTFVTALATDTLFADDTPKDLVQKAKYQGPMYLDLDSSDIAESIEGAKTLWAKLQKYELTASDVQIFLSGKKGLHFIIPEVCYVQKVQPTQGLVAIYKEMAFALAVDTLDFRVYTAKRGRQFRTCYNVRENGNYKVPITALELETLTAENYADYCKAPRSVSGHAPAWRGKFALMYDQAAQKIGKIKPKVMKPVSPEMLRQQLPLFTKLASGQVETSGGFNVIAMQLGLYARESGWSEDQLVQLCAGLIAGHNSDGSRYNTPRRRERELRRMFWYLEDNPAFDYSAAGIKSCLKTEPILIPVADETGQTADDEGDIEVGEESQFGGVYAGRSAYMAVKGEEGDVAISNFVLRKVRLLRDLEEGSIIQIIANVHVSGKFVSEGVFIPANFTGNTGLQNSISTYGGSFSGSDVHARGVYQTMLREIAEDSYVVDSEGVNIVSVGRKPAREFVIWADRDGVKSAATDIGVNLTFQGFPDVRGLYRTDLLSAPTLSELLSSEAGRASALKCFSSLVKVHNPDVIGKMLGWSVAAFFAPLFQKVHGRFPLLHVYGPAGNGKTDTIRGLLRMYYHRAELAETSPNSSMFAMQQFLGGSASIPLFIDEYKPHEMQGDKHNQIRALFRDAYNAKDVQRGGGSRSVKDNFNALSSIKLAAPIVFAAEAPETETAIVERSVMVSFRRLTGRQQIECYKNALQFYDNTTPLASLGLELASRIVGENDPKKTLERFSRLLEWANEKFLPAPDDYEQVAAGTMTQQQMRARAVMRPRPVFNGTVAFFGLQMLKTVLLEAFGAEVFEKEFAEVFKEMGRGCFVGMDTLAAATLPEFVKVLSVFSDMSKLQNSDYALNENVDYNLSELGGKPVLVVAAVQCYRKYRAYMRSLAAQPLYPSEESFHLALREIPQFMQQGMGTKRLETATCVLDLEELYRAAVPTWKGAAVELKF